ncbi:MAG: Omp28-related outer membrane protein [Saprospiraceae bacterium]|nr:Omp28-related outer membrane protein [Saprospiraceae bacterium]MCF8250383.1 Omp28-related outer membrane protein [Saprospiraceae bacterium]MCF8281547.1 Omp28-related outer membrane protein [Bacteroidales bacterium]MCF8312242.1 Omp28-related outer membrane protein [Saprospiraceae bacterium]MCF8440583.1 Omp28-related outer membrane protein [Saprospiraceae bacterium]
MKKSSFTILIAVLFLMKGIAQQVEQKQRILVTKRTADWCPYCGTWGWDYFKNAIEQNESNAVFMAAHYDGGLYDQAAKEITDNWGGFYQPKFFANEMEQGVTSNNVTSKLADLKYQLDILGTIAPIANSGFEPVYENGEIKVAAKVKFFGPVQASGEFYLGIYLLEDHVTAYQASIGANAVHRHLFRKSFTEETFGQLVINGNVSAGQEFSLNFSTPVDEITGHEYEIVGIIWMKQGDKYIPVNVWGTSQIETVSAVSDPLSQNRMVVYPTVASQKASVSVESLENQSVAQLEVFDLTGRRVAVLLNGQLNAGSSRFQLDREMVGGNGLYLVQLKTPGFVKTEKVVFQ